MSVPESALDLEVNCSEKARQEQAARCRNTQSLIAVVAGGTEERESQACQHSLGDMITGSRHSLPDGRTMRVDEWGIGRLLPQSTSRGAIQYIGQHPRHRSSYRAGARMAATMSSDMHPLGVCQPSCLLPHTSHLACCVQCWWRTIHTGVVSMARKAVSWA